MNTSMKTSLFPIAGTSIMPTPVEFEKFLKHVNRELIGAERNLNRYFQDSPLNTSNYPPYNLEKFGENNYRITVAIAGFSKEDVEIVVENGLLTIDGQATGSAEKSATIETDADFLYRGIANRDFKLRFTLADHVEVKEARFENGLLCLDLQRDVPEAMKPHVIEIK